MGYFSNGTEGACYEEEYCDRCVHRNGSDGDGMCPVWAAHLLHNYDECDNEDSILHMLIPRTEDGVNEKCLMFIEDSQREIFEGRECAA
jgi:hypothetical protein